MAAPSLYDTSSCEWESYDVYAKTCEHWGEASVTRCFDDASWTGFTPQRCVSLRFRAVRFGPFESRPGQWRTFGAGTFTDLIHDGEEVTGFIGTVTKADGARIGFPPLHAHHIHVRKGDVAGGLDRRTGLLDRPTSHDHADHWFEAHGDYTTGDGFGDNAADATRGYATHLPAGYCYRVNSASDIDVNAEVNDVRVAHSLAAANSSAPAIEYYLLVAFELSAAPRSARLSERG